MRQLYVITVDGEECYYVMGKSPGDAVDLTRGLINPFSPITVVLADFTSPDPPLVFERAT